MGTLTPCVLVDSEILTFVDVEAALVVKGVMLFPAFHVLGEKVWVSMLMITGQLFRLFSSLLCLGQRKGKGQQASGRAKVKSAFWKAVPQASAYPFTVCGPLVTPAEREVIIFN